LWLNMYSQQSPFDAGQLAVILNSGVFRYLLRTGIITPYLTLRYVVRSGFIDIYPIFYGAYVNVFRLTA